MVFLKMTFTKLTQIKSAMSKRREDVRIVLWNTVEKHKITRTRPQ